MHISLHSCSNTALESLNSISCLVGNKLGEAEDGNTNERYYRASIFPQGGGGTPYNGLYGEARPRRSALFRLELYKRVGISRV